MEYLVSQKEMQIYDENTIKYRKVPGTLLMERAALKTAEQIIDRWPGKEQKVLVAAGSGNNGGDGIAVGRLLWQAGYTVDCVLLGNRAKVTKQTALQIEIWEAYGQKLYDTIPTVEYDIVVDAIFGVGLTRDIEGTYAEIIKRINQMNAHVCAVDIPSGIHADTGRVMGHAVSAELTVTFGFRKIGQCLYPGAAYCGEVVCAQMGIDVNSFLGQMPRIYTYNDLSDVRLPERRPDGNKGTFGKAVVIAGSKKMCGAALLAAQSIFRSGAGMVKLITSADNKESILQNLPECMYALYDETELSSDVDIEKKEEYWRCFTEEVKSTLTWADCILIGPGISTDEIARRLFRICLYESKLPIVIDADGLRLLAEEIGHTDEAAKGLINESLKKPGKGVTEDMAAQGRIFEDRVCILTPHLGEFAALYGCKTSEAKEHIPEYPKLLADRLYSIVVCKDARTVVAFPDSEELYLNLSGNAGMATAGSGDVLAGLITGLLTQYVAGSKRQSEKENDVKNVSEHSIQSMIGRESAVNGVYLHGLAGDMAREIHGERGMLAGDIGRQLTELLRRVKA